MEDIQSQIFVSEETDIKDESYQMSSSSEGDY